ncbi:MAG: sterol desaturase family protein [bacterium]|nr:sterol desaturase family protein [bacterium]
MPNRNGLPRAFDLTRVGYFLDFALVPIASVTLAIFASWRGLGGPGVVAAISAGVIAWSLAEYWIHRLVFHGPTAFEPMHQMHHALPKDLIGVASWGTFVGFAGVWLVTQVFAGPAIGSAVTAGFLAGYLFYCSIHISMHHFAARGFGRYGAMMRSLHSAHHRGGKGNFGVSSPVWDVVFRTYQRS